MDNRPLKLAGIAAVALIGLAALFVTLTPAPTEAPSAPPGAPTSAERAPPPGLRSVPPAAGALGSDDPAAARAGLAVEGARRPPSVSPHAWRQQQVLLGADWRDRTLELTQAWAHERGLDFETTDALLTAWDTMFDAMAASRPAVGAGPREAVESRRLADQAEADAHAAIEALLGPEDAADLLKAVRTGP